MSEGMIWLRAPWPEETVPKGEPQWQYFEVAPTADNVLRMVEVFSDGKALRNSLALQDRRGVPVVSLVHGSFAALSQGQRVEPVARETFEGLWPSAADLPAFPQGLA